MFGTSQLRLHRVSIPLFMTLGRSVMNTPPAQPKPESSHSRFHQNYLSDFFIPQMLQPVEM